MYLSYMKEGIGLGRRPELVGGGLIRSLGGWEAVKRGLVTTARLLNPVRSGETGLEPHCRPRKKPSK